MNFIDRFLEALTNLKPHKRTIFDDIADAKRKAGIPPKPPINLRGWR